MKIYTKTGDEGKTSLLTGKRVPKYHPRIEAYGTLDELNSFIGLLLSNQINENDRSMLGKIQSILFEIGTLLALDKKDSKFKIKEITNDDIHEIEVEIDKIAAILPELRAFIIPGGNQTIATCHICRTICRRAERICTHLSENEVIDKEILIYLNRLSDYFFMLARKIAFEEKIDLPIWKNY